MALFRPEHRQLVEFNYPGHQEYSDLLSSLGGFLEKRVLPSASKLDGHEGEIGPVRRALLENGFCQISYPREYGGMGLPFGVYSIAVELAGAADASVALSAAIHNTAAEGIFRFADKGLKDSYLPGLLSGRKLASFCLTEPTSGSDARAIGAKATRKGGEYVLNGSKVFITNAGEADVYFVFAATEKGPSCFLVDRDCGGLSVGGDIQKLGMRGSRTAEVRFADCRVAADRLVGEEGRGFEYAKAMLNGSRVVMGSLCVGIAQAAFDKAAAYSKQRKAFGSTISEFQLVRGKIADMKTDIDAGRLLCMHASRMREAGIDYASEASQAKVFSTEASLRVCDSALQVFGGAGYTTDDVHRHWRDARLLTIGEGTSEVLRLLIASKELNRLP